MEVPLSPLEFLRRARKVHGAREAVVDGELRLTYRQFGERCDRWSAALARLGVSQGDRVGTISPNTHQHLEQFYSIPQLGAVLVPMNYRLTPEDFVYMANHSGCRILCVHADYLEAVNQVRERMQSVKHFVALEGGGPGWWEYERLLDDSDAGFERPAIEESDLLTINYTSGTTADPKG
ncbi:MAG: AMP-binding protein, partial [Gammaproteobacteria bacterium]|nr:AMP-binding protein [Gammaproteobacteria bacterium]